MTAYTPVNATMARTLRFGVSAGGAVAPYTATQRLALKPGCDVTARKTLVAPDDELRGQIAHFGGAVTEGNYPCGGSFSLVPRPDELEALLPLIFGGTWSGNNLDPDAVPAFGFTFDRYDQGVANAATGCDIYAGCKVASATFSCSAGQQLALQCQIEGTTVAHGASSTFPTLALSTQQPYMMYQGSLTLGSYTARYFNNVQVQINNGLILDRFMNSQTRTEIPQGDRVVTVSFDNPFTSAEADLFALTYAGCAGSLVFTNGAKSLGFYFDQLQHLPVAPAAPSKQQEMPLRLQFTARQKSGGTYPQELRVVKA